MRDTATDETNAATAPILIVPYMWIGDFVRCHTVVRLLRERYPHRPVDVLTTAMVAPLLDYMPGVRKGIVFDLPRKRLAWSLHRELAGVLRGQGYGDALIMPRTWKAALAPALAGIPVRTGFLGEMRFGLVNDLRAGEKALPRNLKLFLEICSLPFDSVARDLERLFLRLGVIECLRRVGKLDDPMDLASHGEGVRVSHQGSLGMQRRGDIVARGVRRRGCGAFLFSARVDLRRKTGSLERRRRLARGRRSGRIPPGRSSRRLAWLRWLERSRRRRMPRHLTARIVAIDLAEHMPRVDEQDLAIIGADADDVRAPRDGERAGVVARNVDEQPPSARHVPTDDR